MQGSIGQNGREETVNTRKNIEENLHLTSTTESNLHMSSTPEVPVESSLNNEALKIAHKAKIIFHQFATSQETMQIVYWTRGFKIHQLFAILKTSTK